MNAPSNGTEWKCRKCDFVIGITHGSVLFVGTARIISATTIECACGKRRRWFPQGRLAAPPWTHH